MKIAFLGAFIFSLTIVFIMYCLSKRIEEGMFALPFLLFILLVPYGLNKEGIE